MTEDERAIRAVIETWLVASKAGDLPTVLDLMTEDVVFLVPGRTPFGKAEFAAASAGMKDVRMEGKSEIEELQVLGDWAFMRSHLEIAATPPGAATPMRRAGYTLTIFRKEAGGKWRLARDANLVTAVE